MQQTDTVIPVRAGTRLEVESYAGETTVRTWDRSAIRIQADYGTRDRIEIRDLGSLLSIKSQSRYGPPRSVEYHITVPVRTDLSVSGVYQDVTVEGVRGAITADVVNGDIRVEGGEGFVSLKSVEGDVSLSGAKARMTLEAVNQDVRVRDSEGDIAAQTINGSVSLENIKSANVDASTVNGDVVYDGTILDAGRYTLSTNNGDVTVSVPPDANATVTVSTFNGEFESSFPVKLTKTARNRFSFVLGSGSARLSVESFQGTIQLARPGEARARTMEKGKHKNKDY